MSPLSFAGKDSIMYRLKSCSLEVFMERTTLISPADVEQQLAFCQSVAELTAR